MRPTTRALNLLGHGDALASRSEWKASLELYRLAMEELGPQDAPSDRSGDLRTWLSTGQLPESAAERRLVEDLRSFVARLIEASLAAERREFQGALLVLRRVAVGVAAFLVLFLGGRILWSSIYAGDISEAATWEASSVAGQAQLRGRLPVRHIRWAPLAYFFHTQPEASPWIKVDLGLLRTVRAVEVVNRLDCCFERAASLDVELSEDGQVFEVVAQRRVIGTPSRRWTASFAPRRARWVRIASARPYEPLHFADVRVFGR